MRHALGVRLHRLIRRLVRPHIESHVDAAVSARLAELETRATVAAAALAALEARSTAAHGGIEAALRDVRGEIAFAQAQGKDALALVDHALAVAREAHLAMRIDALSAWLELVPPAEGPLISIVLATRDRPELLTRAMASVIAQRYPSWELVVVDDGSGDGTKAVIAEQGDSRIAFVEGPRRGLGAARNVGLDRARGDVVGYLDDDNVMDPSWLQAVAYVFANREDVDVMYGVSVAEHRVPGSLAEDGWRPAYWQLPWSRETLLCENVTDAGAIAHRRDLDGARFDEELPSCEDWDLLLRLTERRDALPVPAVSHAYALDTEGRMSADPVHRKARDEVRRRHGGESVAESPRPG
jgi:Glycosyl transferase family 2